MALKIYRNMANCQKKLQGLVVAFREVTKKNLRRGELFGRISRSIFKE